MGSTKKFTLIAAFLSAGILGAVSTSAQESDGKAGMRAENEMKVQMAVAAGSKAWKDAFNAGDAAAAAALYEEDAVMIVKPIGTFKGRKEILAFWTDIVSKGFDDVVYINTVTTILDDQSASVSAGWKMNKAKGVITNEHWVVQPDGRALMREDHFEIAQ